MEEEREAPSVEDSPPEGQQHEAPEATPQETNWEQRFKDTQASYTRSQQDLAQLQQWQSTLLEDPDAQRQLLDHLGYQIEESEGESEHDPVLDLQARQDALEAQLTQSQQTQQEEQMLGQMDQFVDTELDRLAEAEGRKDGFTEREQKVILSHAVAAFPPGENGMPNVQAAYDELSALLGDAQQRWVKSKKSYLPPQPGSSGTEKLDLSDDEARLQATARIVDRGLAS